MRGKPVAGTPITKSTRLAKDAVDGIFAANQGAPVTLIGMPEVDHTFVYNSKRPILRGAVLDTVERRDTAVDRESNRPEPSGAINLQTMVRSSLGQNSLSGTKRAFLHVTINTRGCTGSILNIELFPAS
jgi:hypothetical protein